MDKVIFEHYRTSIANVIATMYVFILQAYNTGKTRGLVAQLLPVLQSSVSSHLSISPSSHPSDDHHFSVARPHPSPFKSLIPLSPAFILPTIFPSMIPSALLATVGLSSLSVATARYPLVLLLFFFFLKPILLLQCHPVGTLPHWLRLEAEVECMYMCVKRTSFCTVRPVSLIGRTGLNRTVLVL